MQSMPVDAATAEALLKQTKEYSAVFDSAAPAGSECFFLRGLLLLSPCRPPQHAAAYSLPEKAERNVANRLHGLSPFASTTFLPPRKQTQPSQRRSSECSSPSRRRLRRPSPRRERGPRPPHPHRSALTRPTPVVRSSVLPPRPAESSDPAPPPRTLPTPRAPQLPGRRPRRGLPRSLQHPRGEPGRLRPGQHRHPVRAPAPALLPTQLLPHPRDTSRRGCPPHATGALC